MALGAAGPGGGRPRHRRDGGRGHARRGRTRWASLDVHVTDGQARLVGADGDARVDRRLHADHGASVRPGGRADRRPARRGPLRLDERRPPLRARRRARSRRAARPTSAWSTTPGRCSASCGAGRWLETRVTGAPTDVRAALGRTGPAGPASSRWASAPTTRPTPSDRRPPRCSTARGPGGGRRRRRDRLVGRRRCPAAHRRGHEVWAGLRPSTATRRGAGRCSPCWSRPRRVAAFHAGRGVPADVSAATLADLGQQIRVHRLVHGAFGLGTYAWETGYVWSGALYRLGRLQFDLERAADGRRHRAGAGSLSTHIPRVRAAGRPPTVDASLAAAPRLLRRHFPDVPGQGVHCHSWMLDPRLPELLPGQQPRRVPAALADLRRGRATATRTPCSSASRAGVRRPGRLADLRPRRCSGRSLGSGGPATTGASSTGGSPRDPARVPDAPCPRSSPPCCPASPARRCPDWLRRPTARGPRRGLPLRPEHRLPRPARRADRGDPRRQPARGRRPRRGGRRRHAALRRRRVALPGQRGARPARRPRRPPRRSPPRSGGRCGVRAAR